MKNTLYHGISAIAGFLLAMTLTPSNSTAQIPEKRPLIVAHRGFSAVAPENTLAAVNLAWETDADGVEVDVYLSKDGQVICLHDANTERVALGGTRLVPSQATYRELAALDVGSWKGEKYRGEKIPLLSEVIATIPPGKVLFVESKDGPEIVPALKRVFRESGKEDQLVVISFNKSTLDAVVETMPHIETLWLLGAPKNERTGERGPLDPEYAALADKFGFAALNVSYLGVTPDLVKATSMAGSELYIWTLDDPAKARELVKMGVAGITTNRPDLMLEEFKAERGQ